MRRQKQALETKENIAILERNTSGTLALCGIDQKPYAVPLSYVYRKGKIYFHVALQGKKLDLIQENANASFCVIDQDEVLPQKFTTKYNA